MRSGFWLGSLERDVDRLVSLFGKCAFVGLRGLFTVLLICLSLSSQLDANSLRAMGESSISTLDTGLIPSCPPRFHTRTIAATSTRS